jgi:hypothetical protein
VEDFFEIVKKKVNENSIEKLLSEWNADPNIKLSISKKPVLILSSAFYEAKNKDSLKNIYDKSGKLKKEIPYAGIIDQDDFLISRFIKGHLGCDSYCDWEKGKLLKVAKKETSENDLKISLGHTHPKSYGAICSKVYWTKKELREMSGKTIEYILNSKIYEKYGGDYSEMFAWTKIDQKMSKIFSIMSPRENQIGFFEVKEQGNIIYHPWNIVDRI